MGLFDAFSSSDENRQLRRGYREQSAQLAAGRKDLKTQYGLGQTALTQGKEEGLGYLGDAYNTARGDLTGGIGGAQDYLTSGANTAAGYYNQALPLWQQLSNQGTQGIEAYGNLLNNPDSVFQSELYKNREGAGIDSLNRLAAGRGMLSSGNNTQDIVDYMRRGGLDYFNTLLGGYSPYFGLAQNAAAGQTGVLGQLGGLYDRLGQNQADLAFRGGTGLAGLADQFGANQANIATGTAGQSANMYSSLGNQLNSNRVTQGQAGSDMHTNMANAKSAADANLWGAILGIGGSLAGAYGA